MKARYPNHWTITEVERLFDGREWVCEDYTRVGECKKEEMSKGRWVLRAVGVCCLFASVGRL